MILRGLNLLPLWGDGKGSHVKKFFSDSEETVSRHLTKRTSGFLTSTNKSLCGNTNLSTFEGILTELVDEGFYVRFPIATKEFFHFTVRNSAGE
jgi:hypothetical protein